MTISTPTIISLALLLTAASAALLAWVLLLRRRRQLEASRIDALTGVGNRRGFDAAITRLDQIDGGTVSIVMLDFDHFKDLNDIIGRDACDDVLVRIAGALTAAVKNVYGDRAQVFRFGGDEFALIVDGADSLHARALLERAREQVDDVLVAAERNLTLSCGIAAAPEHAHDIRELVSYADRAVYQAKRMGRDRSIVYEPTMFDADADRDARNILRVLGDVLAAAVDAKDAYTHAHSRNVSDLSLYLARAMGLDDSTVDDIALGGLLHDIGKIGVSDDVLNKPGKLSDAEYDEIKTHCDIGYAILSGISGAEHIREMVLYHHERPDGRGYPRGLAADEIPLSARIIGVADAFDSMTAKRVYSTPLGAEDAIAEIVRLRGQQFDPDVVDALCRLMVYDLDYQGPVPDEGDEDGPSVKHVRAA